MTPWQDHYNAMLRAHVRMCSNIAGGANSLRMIERYIDQCNLTFDKKRVRDWVARIREGLTKLLEDIANRN